jgi:HlyD family secretion protein
MKKYIIPLACIGLIGLVIATIVSSNHSERYPKLITVTPESFDITVNTVGVLDAARSHMVSSTIRGDRGKIIYLIGDGTRVNKDDVLAKLDTAPFEEEVRRLESEVQSLEAAVAANKQMFEWEKNQMEREIQTAQYNLKVAELDLKRLQQGEGPLKLTGFKSEMTKAQKDYKRYLAYISDLEELSQKGFDNPREITSAREKYAELKEKHETAEKNYSCYKEHVFPSLIKAGEAKVKQTEIELGQLKKGGIFKVAKAKSGYDEVFGKLQTAQRLLATARNDLEKTVIRAPSSGIAIHYEAYREGSKRKPREGDRVIQNQPLLYLPDISAMIVKTQVREIDLHKLVKNQECKVQVDAYPDSMLEGQVAFIGALASENFRLGRGEKYFELTIALKDKDERLRPGMTARVSILSDSINEQLTIPVQAVFEEAGTKLCYKYLEKRFKKVGITIGRQNEDLVVVLSGLSAGDQVSLIKPDMD